MSAETGDDAAAWRLGRRPRADRDRRLLHADRGRRVRLGADRRRRTPSATSTRWAARRSWRSTSPGWPVDDLPLDLLARVLQGGQDVAADAGAVVVGGHTITATEPIYGMVALGFADADRLVRNSTAAPGERLFLTKPIGTGLIATAIKRGSATAEQAEAAVRTDDHVERRRGRGHGRGRRRRGHRRHRVRPARPPAQDAGGERGGGAHRRDARPDAPRRARPGPAGRGLRGHRPQPRLAERRPRTGERSRSPSSSCSPTRRRRAAC